MKWEYMHVIFSFNRNVNRVSEEKRGKKCYNIDGSFEFLIEKLDEFGAMGWEISGGYSTYMLFKRPVS